MLANKLKTLLESALKDGLKTIDGFRKETKEKGFWWRLEHHSGYPKMSFTETGFPSFYLSDHEKVDFSKILTTDSTGEQIPSWKDYHISVTSSEELQKFYQIGKYAGGPAKHDNELWQRIFTYFFLADFVDRYIHLNDGKTHFEQNLFEKLSKLFFNSIFNQKLGLEIHIPILLLAFDFDELRFDHQVSVQRMEDRLQRSRHGKTSYTDSSNSIVAGSATHALVIKGFFIENTNFTSRENSLNDIKSYDSALIIANDFFSALRTKTGAVSGFSQIVGKRVGWENRTKGDLYDVDVVSARNYPDHFDDYGWLNKPTLISEVEMKDTFHFFEAILKNERNNINLALSRLNRSYLRSREEDTILDICIGLETLLTHDSKSEITYRLSARLSSLCLIKPFKEYEPFEVFNFCKGIYAFRSAVIHGSHKSLGKTRVIKVQENKEIPTINLSIELLRHVLEILLEHPQLNDPKTIDKLRFDNDLNEL